MQPPLYKVDREDGEGEKVPCVLVPPLFLNLQGYTAVETYGLSGSGLQLLREVRSIAKHAACALRPYEGPKLFADDA